MRIMKSASVEKLFEEEEKVIESVREISQGILDLSEFANAKSPVELAECEIVGKRMRNACDKINDEIHKARKVLGILMLHKEAVVFKRGARSLREMEDELSLIHGDVESIGVVAENFFEASDRKIAFENLNKQYGSLMEHVMSLLSSESKMRELL